MLYKSKFVSNYLNSVSYNDNSNKGFHVIQSSRERTGSTLAYNLLCGLIQPRKNQSLGGPEWTKGKKKDLAFIIKTHSPINEWIRCYPDLKLFFVTTERKKYGTGPLSKYHSHPQVAVFKYEKLLETDTYSIEDIVDYAYNTLKTLLPNTVTLNKDDALKRIQMMNEVEQELKDKPYKDDEYEPFTGIHGSHRNR